MYLSQICFRVPTDLKGELDQALLTRGLTLQAAGEAMVRSWLSNQQVAPTRPSPPAPAPSGVVSDVVLDLARQVANITSQLAEIQKKLGDSK